MNPTIEQGFVYLITPQSSTLHKIGYTSTSIERRMAQLQTGSATELQLVASWNGTQGHETALHRKLAKYRKQGEWFRFPKIVVRELQLLDPLDMDALKLPDYTNEAQANPMQNLIVAARELIEISSGQVSEIAKAIHGYSEPYFWTKENEIETDPLEEMITSLRLMGLKGREQKRFARIESSFKCVMHWKSVETRWQAKFGRVTMRAAMRGIIEQMVAHPAPVAAQGGK